MYDFLLAEERKKQKMFSHTMLGALSNRVVWIKWAHFVVASAIAWPPTHPPIDNGLVIIQKL